MGRAKGLVLFPGAGSASTHSALVKIGEQIKPIPTGRFDFPYRLAGKRPPDRAPVLLRCVRSEVQAFALHNHVRTSSLVIGGRSMGGRMCSLAAAGDTGVPDEIGQALKVRGLVLISYPLYPPASPHKLRIAHFGRIDVPVLFVHGTKDPFGTPKELQVHSKKIVGDVSFHFIDNARHELKNADDEVAEVVSSWVMSLR